MAFLQLVIEPRGAWEHSAYQTDNQFVLEVRPVKIDGVTAAPITVVVDATFQHRIEAPLEEYENVRSKGTRFLVAEGQLPSPVDPAMPMSEVDSTTSALMFSASCAAVRSRLSWSMTRVASSVLPARSAYELARPEAKSEAASAARNVAIVRGQEPSASGRDDGAPLIGQRSTLGEVDAHRLFLGSQSLLFCSSHSRPRLSPKTFSAIQRSAMPRDATAATS